MGYVCKTGYSSVLRGNGALTQATSQGNRKNAVLSGSSQTQGTAERVIPFLQNVHGCVIFHCVDILRSVPSLIGRWTFGFLPLAAVTHAAVSVPVQAS